MKTIQFLNQKNIIHKRLLLARKKANLSQQQLAAKLQTMGVSIDQQAISKIEKNARIVTDYEVVCLCRALTIEESWLLGGIEELENLPGE